MSSRPKKGKAGAKTMPAKRGPAAGQEGASVAVTLRNAEKSSMTESVYDVDPRNKLSTV